MYNNRVIYFFNSFSLFFYVLSAEAVRPYLNRSFRFIDFPFKSFVIGSPYFAVSVAEQVAVAKTEVVSAGPLPWTLPGQSAHLV
jgi:hypothetical protein